MIDDLSGLLAKLLEALAGLSETALLDIEPKQRLIECVRNLGNQCVQAARVNVGELDGRPCVRGHRLQPQKPAECTEHVAETAAGPSEEVAEQTPETAASAPRWLA